MFDVVGENKPGESPVDEKEKNHCERLLKRIKSFDGALKERAENWKKARNYADGDVQGDKEDGLVRVNLVGSMLDTIQPAIYAKAPEITVEVDDRIDTESYPMLGKFAKTVENALNVFLVKDAKLKKRGKAAVRSSLTSTIGFFKVIYQREKKDDPQIKNRINDTQDNVDRIKALIEETKAEGGECAEHNAKIYELNQQLKGLGSQIEVVVSEGLVVDIVPPEDVIVLDASCRDVDEFMQATEIAQRIKMTVGAFKTQFKKSPPQGHKTYVLTDNTDDAAANEKSVDEDDKIICVYEVWSLNDLTVYTLLEGVHEYIRPPYQPKALGEQWYPFFGLQLRRVEGKKYPRSMVEQIIELADEYNTRRTNASEHRRKNLPVRVFNKSGGITDEEITKLNGRTIGTDIVGITSDTQRPLQDQMASLDEIPYNPQMYDTSDILFDMEKVAGVQDAASGSIRVAKTATEAEIASAGQQGRTGEALDVIEDCLTDIAIYSAQLLLQNVPAEVIKARFGAESVWPELDKKTLFSMVNIGIRAGSTSKPNKMRERDQWIQMLPEIQKALETLIAAKEAGNTQLEEVTINLLDETFKRFDEKLDAKAMLGLVDDEGNALEGNQAPQIPPQVKQAMEATKMQLEEVTTEAQKLSEENQKLKLKGRETELKHRQLDLQERDLVAKEDVATSETTKNNITVDALNQVMQSSAIIAQQVTELVSAAKHETTRKTAKATKLPNGDWVMESVETETVQ